MNAYFNENGGAVWIVADGEHHMLHGSYGPDEGERIAESIRAAINDVYAEGRKDEAEEHTTATLAGWQLVPIEPTPKMLPLLTGYVSLDGMNERDRSVIETRFRARWAEILAAAAAEYTEGHEAALASAGRLEFIPRTECDDPERCRQFKFCRRHPHPSCGVVPA